MSRLNPYVAAPDETKRLIDYAQTCGADLEPSLKHLVQIRASQLNGCAICLHMHAQEARHDGETEARVYMLDAWQEAGIYSEREKAALAWTEALTRLSETRAPDAAYDAVLAQFTPSEVVQLTMVINVINSFNRLGVGFHVKPLGLVRAEAA